MFKKQYDPTRLEVVENVTALHCCVNANPSRCFPDNSEGPPITCQSSTALKQSI